MCQKFSYKINVILAGFWLLDIRIHNHWNQTFEVWSQRLQTHIKMVYVPHPLHSGAYKHHGATKIWVNPGSGNDLSPDGKKPLPEPHLHGPDEFKHWTQSKIDTSDV